jgi:hypothetical protein
MKLITKIHWRHHSVRARLRSTGESPLAYDTDKFRAQYRAGIHRYYVGLLHGGFVFLYAAAWLGFFVRTIHDVRPLEWLVVPAALVFFNWGEYTVHRSFGHTKRPLGMLFYRRHTGDHHSFFVETRMPYEEARDWRVILFPAWLIVLYTLFLALPAYFLLGLISTNLGALAASTLVIGYLTYEFFHSCQHLPDENPLTKLPWIRWMRRHHALHHRRALMTSKNFNLVFPLMDWLHGTYYSEPAGAVPASTTEAVQ